MLVEQSSGTIIPVVNPMSGIPFQFSSHEPDILEKAQELSVRQENINGVKTFEDVLELRTAESNREKGNAATITQQPGVTSISGAIMELLGGN
jgi:hypothetical protein